MVVSSACQNFNAENQPGNPWLETLKEIEIVNRGARKEFMALNSEQMELKNQ